MSSEQPDARYLAQIEGLSPGYAKVRLLHRVIGRHMDLKPLDTVVSLRLPKAGYDSVMMLYMSTKPAIIEVLDGRVVNAINPSDVEMRPVEKSHLQMEPTDPDIYATIYASAENAEQIRNLLMSINFHWTHEIAGMKHVIPVSDAIEKRSTHCAHCAELRLKRKVHCFRCDKLTDPMYPVTNEILGMVTLALKHLNSGGSFSVRENAGTLTIQCKGFEVRTNAVEINTIIEKAIAEGGKHGR
ncbi:MAG: hypothetical protein JRN54_08000 [Nitrososphaerota archaeon]|jgi:hypothetical protein|nr:hypothetical protein [Nitrososphaerota archaeon]